MTAVDTTVRTQSEAISFEFDLQHAPEKVWRALSDPELLSQWLLPVVGLTFEPGATFTLQAPPKPGWDGTVNCRFLEIEAHRKLRYTWSVPFLDTVVTFTLTASGTLLSLVHSGFKPTQKQNFAGARFGWRMMGGKLVELLPRIP